MNASATLLQLRQLATEMRGLSAFLVPACNVLGSENVEFVVNTSAILENEMTLLTSTAQVSSPLESSQFRHDLRNKVAVIKGFSDLMRMDLNPGDHLDRVLERLMELSDQVVQFVEQAKGQSGQNSGAAIFA